MTIIYDIERYFWYLIEDAPAPYGLALLLIPVVVIIGVLVLGRLVGRAQGQEGTPAVVFSINTIVIVIIIVLLAITLPGFFRARNTSNQNACISNLRMIDSGKEQWAMANQLVDGDPVSTASVNEYLRGFTPQCPAGGSYTYGTIGQDPDCNADGVTSHNFAG